jgi:hypothetical protein
MTDDNDLVKRLRLKRERCHDLSGVYYTEDADCQAAADRIEALTEQLEAARLDAEEAEAYSVWLEAKLGKTEDFVRRVIRYAGNNGDDFLADKGREALLELRGENDE